MREGSIFDIASNLGLPEEALEPRGYHILKVEPVLVREPIKGRVVLVSAMTPTPEGEGKTTTLIGLLDGLRRLEVKAVGALRQPSLGPLFGRKGGATGGGRAKLFPEETINLHFTGDIHAVTSAHNLLAAIVDNHLYLNEEPFLDPARLCWGRVLDMNDRALRRIRVGLAPEIMKQGASHNSGFDITAASEVMAILCLAKDATDLRQRLDRILVGFTHEGEPVTAKTLGASGAMAAILIDALRPNLVRTLEGSPCFVHGGPFANIAQGTSSLIATQLARRVSDIVLTEAGFAFDLGGFKFFDLLGRAGGFLPDAIVLVATVRALRAHGGADPSAGPNENAVTKGLENIAAHLDAMERLGIEAIIAVNRFPDDHPSELSQLRQFANLRGVSIAESTHFAEGGKGAESLAKVLVEHLARHPQGSSSYVPPYKETDSVLTKIEQLARTVLGAEGILLSEQAKNDLAVIERLGASHLPLCLAKTHLSLSADKSLLGRPAPFILPVTSLRPQLGAGFNVVLCGDIVTMPGLPRRPAASHIDIEINPQGTCRVVGLK